MERLLEKHIHYSHVVLLVEINPCIIISNNPVKGESDQYTKRNSFYMTAFYIYLYLLSYLYWPIEGCARGINESFFERKQAFTPMCFALYSILFYSSYLLLTGGNQGIKKACDARGRHGVCRIVRSSLQKLQNTS